MNALEILNQLFPAQVLGWTIIHTLWIGLFIWLLFVIGKSLMQRSALLKYYWGLSMQLLLLMAFCSAFLIESGKYLNENKDLKNINIEHGSTTSLFSLTQKNVSINNFSDTEFVTLLNTIAPIISSLWILGAFLMIMRFTANIFYVQNLRNTGIKAIEQEWQYRFDSLLGRLKLKDKIQLLESELIDSPLTLGHLKPIVLVPIGMLGNLPYEQVEAILLHELAHIKRSDYLINMIQNIIEALLFFHPVTWIISSNIRMERENLCDDYSVKTQKNPVYLAKALFEIQKNVNHIPGLALGSNHPKYLLKNRIERLFNDKSTKSRNGKGILPAIVLTVLLLSLSIVQFSEISAAKSEGLEVLKANILIPGDNIEAEDKIEKEKSDSFSKAPAVDPFDSDKSTQKPISDQKKSNDLFLLVGNNEIEIKKTSNDGKKIEIVFTNPDNIKKLKIDGKKIKPEDYDKYEKLLNKEVFNSYAENNKSQSISYSYSIDDNDAEVIEIEEYGESQKVAVKSGAKNNNTIIVKIKDGEGKTRIIETPDPDSEIIEIREDLEEVMSDLDFEFEMDLENFSEEVIESVNLELLEHNLAEASRALEKTSKELEEKSKALSKELSNVEMKNAQEEIQKAIEEIKVQMKRIKQEESEIEEDVERVRVEANVEEAEGKKANGKFTKMITQLEEDGILEKNSKKVKVEFKKGLLIVNGKEQKKEVAEKYIEMFDIDKSANITYNKTRD